MCGLGKYNICTELVTLQTSVNHRQLMTDSQQNEVWLLCCLYIQVKGVRREDIPEVSASTLVWYVMISSIMPLNDKMLAVVCSCESVLDDHCE